MMPTAEPIRAAVVCRYPLVLSGIEEPAGAYLYFLADDIELAAATDGASIITSCQAIEIIAVA